MNRRIVQVHVDAHFVTLLLACRHSIKRRLAWWQNPVERERFADCPNCGRKKGKK